MGRNKIKSADKIQWHPAFCAAAEIELRDNKNELIFHAEYNLSKKPLQIDLLIIEKQKRVLISNEIGHIFRKHNVLEYKSPDDGMTIDDFCKTLAYAYLYKGLSEKVNHIPLNELTISLFRDVKPGNMMKELENCGCKIEKYTDGIYYVTGGLIPAQIVVMNELKSGMHSALKVLSRDAKNEDIQEFIETTNSYTEPGEKEKADAVMQVSISANREKYDAIRRDLDMCEALRLLMKDEIEEELQKARTEGKKIGLEEGRREGRREGRLEGRLEGHSEGRLEGQSEGRREGEIRLSKLYQMLVRDNRQEEIPRMMEDEDYRAKLLKEYCM